MHSDNPFKTCLERIKAEADRVQLLTIALIFQGVSGEYDPFPSRSNRTHVSAQVEVALRSSSPF